MTRRTPSPLHRVIAGIGLATGVFLVASPFVLDYPAKTQGVDRLTDSLRTTMTDDGLAQVRSDMDAVNSFVAQFETEAAPALAAQLTSAGALERPEDLDGFIGENFPALGEGLAQFDDPILPYFNQIVDGLEAEQADFHRGDAIPTTFLPTTSVPFVFVAIGLVVTAVSVAGLAGWRSSGVALGGIGLLVVIVVFALQMPTKTKAVDDLTGAFRGVFTEAGAQEARDHLDTVAAAGTELQEDALPAIAQALDIGTDTLVAGLSEQYPAVAAGLRDLPAILGRLDGLVTAVETNLDSFDRADSIPTSGQPTTLFTWHLLAPGLLLALTGAVALVAARRHRDDAVHVGIDDGAPLVSRAPIPEETGVQS